MSSRSRTSYLIKRVELIVRSRLEVVLRDLDITTGQYAALSLLAAMPETSSAQLARSVGVTPQTMTDTILAFEYRGLISRERSSEHKRILKISLTEEGRALVRKCEGRVSSVEGELFGVLDKNDLDQLRSSLLAIAQGSDEQRD